MKIIEPFMILSVGDLMSSNFRFAIGVFITGQLGFGFGAVVSFSCSRSLALFTSSILNLQ